jgi:hypothetical protein
VEVSCSRRRAPCNRGCQGKWDRISIRNGFTRPTGDINVNSPYIVRSPRERKTSRRIFVICHFSFGDRPLGGSLQQFHGVRHGCAVDLPTLQTAIEAL